MLHNSRSTNPYTSSTKSPTDNQSPRKNVRSVKPTDKKSAYELNNYGNCPIKLNSSCINKTAERQVPFPRSNRAGMHMGKLIDRHGNTAKQWEKAPKSTNRILRQNRIEMNQSAASDFSQSATLLIDLSQPRVYASTDQAEASNPGSFYYKSRCRSQFVSPVSPRTENSTIDATYSASRNILSSIGVRSQRHLSNTPVRRQSTVRVNYLPNNSVRCQATRVNQLSNTPVRRSASPRYWSTPTESTGFNLDELALVLMDQQPNPKTADKATQAPEKQPYVCYVCGHKVMELANHRRHMLSSHQMDLVGIAVVYDDNPFTNQ